MNEPEPVLWPRAKPLLVGLIPVGVMLVLAPWTNEHPWVTFGFGAVLFLVWQAVFGKLFAHGLDFWSRTVDFIVNRTYGPALEKGTGICTAVCCRLSRGGLLHGYSPLIALWTVLLLLIVIFGPTRTPLQDWSQLFDHRWFEIGGGLAIILVAVAILVTGFTVFSWQKHWLHGFTTVLILLTIAATVAWIGKPAFTEKDGGSPEADTYIYPHIFMLFIAATALLAYSGRWLACWMMCAFKEAHGAEWSDPRLLKQAELFVQLPQQESLKSTVKSLKESFWPTVLRNLRSTLDTPLRHPHLVLFPVAVVVLLAPQAYMNLAAVISLLFMWSVLTLSGIYDRLNILVGWLQRACFHGVLWVVSLFVILLAACRFLEVSYIATLVNSASLTTLVWFLLAIYVTLWYYKYWVGQALCEAMLDILQTKSAPGENTIEGQVRYLIDPRFKTTKVDVEERVLQVHGTKVAVVGKFRFGDVHGQAWQFYEPIELFETILKKQPRAHTTESVAHAESESDAKDVVCLPTDPFAVDKVYALIDLRQRVTAFYGLLDLIVVGIVVLFFVLRQQPTPIAELEANQKGDATFELEKHLFESPEKSKAVVLVAASGGGTRAALYSAAVLRGLEDAGALGDVKLASGVSGGSTAIAHLAIHRDSLTKGGPKDKNDAWNEYAAVMCAPFIDDVLCGTLETRIAFGTRMGNLLDESFHRHMYRAAPIPHKDGKTLKDAPFGIIFNSTLAGSVPHGKPADPTHAGSRLIVTNLRVPDKAFPDKDSQFKGLESEYLQFIVVNDLSTRLTTGAALSANFPPVFSNAAVDLKDGNCVAVRHWVTDGGAAENRGDVSLLFVVKRILEREAAKDKDVRRKPLPIHLVIAEASAASLDFSQNRGISSAFGASGKFANQLVQDLLHHIDKNYQTLNGPDFKVHYLPMPLVFRARGGVGTHWKMSAYVKLANPKDKKLRDRDDKADLILNERETRELIMDLYRPDADRWINQPDQKDNKVLKLAWRWIEGKDADVRFVQHRKNWEDLIRALHKLGYPAKE